MKGNKMFKSIVAATAIAIVSSAAYAEVGSLNSNVTNVTDSVSNSNNVSTVSHVVQGNSGTTVNNKAVTPNGYVATVPVIASAGTCLGSNGGGISAAGIGLSSNKTVKDEDCNTRQDRQLEQNIMQNQVTMLTNLGLKSAAVSLMCQDDNVRVALRQSLPEDQYIALCLVYDVK